MSILIKGMDKPTECFFCPFKNVPTEPFTFCRKDRCPVIKVDKDAPIDDENNSISCDECEIAKYHNLEDDDTPCQNCEEPDAD